MRAVTHPEVAEQLVQLRAHRQSLADGPELFTNMFGMAVTIEDQEPVPEA